MCRSGRLVGAENGCHEEEVLSLVSGIPVSPRQRDTTSSAAVRPDGERLMDVGISKRETHGRSAHVETPYARALLSGNANRIVPAFFNTRDPALECQRVVFTQRLHTADLEPCL